MREAKNARANFRQCGKNEGSEGSEEAIGIGSLNCLQREGGTRQSERENGRRGRSIGKCKEGTSDCLSPFHEWNKGAAIESIKKRGVNGRWVGLWRWIWSCDQEGAQEVWEVFWREWLGFLVSGVVYK